jgi:hypothetical protein
LNLDLESLFFNIFLFLIFLFLKGEVPLLSIAPDSSNFLSSFARSSSVFPSSFLLFKDFDNRDNIPFFSVLQLCISSSLS